MNRKVYREIFESLEETPVIDTHEHLPFDEKKYINDGNDVLTTYLAHYIRSDVVSAGLNPQDLDFVCNSRENLLRRWKIVEPYWEASRYTGYGRVLDLAASALYNIDEINSNTIEELNEKYLKLKQPGIYHHILHEKCNIKVAVVDIWSRDVDLSAGNPIFRAVWQPLNYIMPTLAENDVLEDIESRLNIRVSTLDDFLEAFDRDLEYRLQKYGVPLLKCAIAYHRSIKFEKVEYKTAKEAFATAFDYYQRTRVLDFSEPLQDFMMHYIFKAANDKGLVFQFHTGLLEGNGNILANSDPTLMNDLFLMYPNIKFDLFHIGYPYFYETAALAKIFPNVFIDMCWSHIISSNISKLALAEFLDTVPYTKISAFGGDYLFPDGVLGHLQLAKMNVSSVLASKVEQGFFGVEKAVKIGQALFYDNPKRILGLNRNGS
ncbi:MAG: amidohydrolase family protein [Firmicutes bacterium]|nr:amidohydrolase family protein [Bacillota bacterium]